VVPFPEIKPFVEGQLFLDDGAEIWWEASGNPVGQPMVWLHGGPGSGLGSGRYRRDLDPEHWQVIGFDQRGCGRSRPLVTTPGFDLGTLTTQRMVADIEALREHLGIEKWLVAGASWGSTLALAYAEAHPDRVTGIVLMAVTSSSHRELAWISEGVGRIYPEAWAELDAASGRRPGQPILEAYLERLTDPDPDVRHAAALAWCTWEDAHVAIGQIGLNLPPGHGMVARDPERRLQIATHVVNNWAHDAWLGEAGVLDGIEAIAHIPGVLIHGRLDVSGPVETAWKLHRRWPASRLVVVENEGHGGPEMARELEAAYAWFAERS
jgi:proline iminopeptidase